MTSIIKYIIIVFTLIVVFAGITLKLTQQFKEKEEVSLSKLVEYVNKGQVENITVKGDDLVVTLSDKTELKSKKEANSSLTESINNLGVDKEKLSQIAIDIKDPSNFSSYLFIFLGNFLPFIIVGIIIWYMFGQAQKGAMNALSFGRSKAKLAEESEEKKVTFKDVAGLYEAKEEISEIVDFLKDPAKFHKLGAKIPRGVLLVGSPGTGKTLLAKAVANEAGVPFYFVSGSEFVEMFVGVGANRVRDTFEMAKRSAPAIIFIDEIDAVGRHRGAGLGGGHDEREQTLNQILVEMDGFDTNSTVIVMAATNRPDILDPALLRPGRFDRRVTLDLPLIKDREEILNIHAKNKPLAKEVELKKVAERTPGFSGADLANLMNEGAILAARKNQTEISQENILQAIEKVILGPEKRSRIIPEKEKRIIAYHEAGHALVGAFTPGADPVHKITIVSRGHAGGYTLKLPTEDRTLKSKIEFEAEIATLLGGFTAEKLIFGDNTTGASNDLKVASEIARSMITRYGMSEKLGPIVFGEREEMVFLGKELGHQRNYSEEIAQKIDEEVHHLIDKGLKKAKDVLTEKKELLEKIANTLLEKETIEQEEFNQIVKQKQ